MEIKAIGARISQKLGSKLIQRSTSTNPFENTSFSGKTFNKSVLPFADVFQKTNKANETSKLKMLSASVVSAVSNFKQRITQPIVNFANNVKLRYNNTISSIKALPERMNAMKNDLTAKISDKLNMHKLEKVENSSETKILKMNEINTKASIKDLKSTWLEENRLMKESSKEVA